MSDVEVRGRISVDTGNSAKSIDEMNTAIKASKKALNEARIGSDEYKIAQAELAKNQADLRRATDEANGTHNKSSEAFATLRERINSTVPGFEAAQTGVKGLGAQLKVLLVNPIVAFLTAIVAVLALVYKAFTNTFEGGEKMKQVFAGIGAAGQALIDNLERIGTVIKDIFTFNWGDAKKGLDEIVDSTKQAYNKTAALTAEKQKLERAQSDNDLDQAKRRQELSRLRELQSSGATYEIRKAAGEKLLADAKVNAAEDIKLAKQVAENQIALWLVEENGAKKHYIEINKIRAQQMDVETQNNIELKQIEKSNNQNEKANAAEREQAAKEQDAKNKERLAQAKANMAELEKLQDATFKKSLNKSDLAILILEQQYKKEQELLKKNHADTLLLEKNFRRDLTAVLASGLKTESIEVTKAVGMKIVADNTVRDSALKSGWDILEAKKIGVSIDKEIAEIRKQALIEEVEGYGAAAGMISGILGNQTVVGKGLAVASASISTFEAITKQLKAFAGIPVPGYAVAQALATGVVGLANVKKIISVQVPGITGASLPTPTLVNAPLAPQAQITALNQSSINAVSNAAQGGVNRAFVLDADIKNNAERDARINRAARLG